MVSTTYSYGAEDNNYDTHCVTGAMMQERIAHLAAKAYYNRRQEFLAQLAIHCVTGAMMQEMIAHLAAKTYYDRMQERIAHLAAKEFLAHLASYDKAHCVTGTRMQGRLTMKSRPSNTAAMKSSPSTTASMAMKSWHSNLGTLTPWSSPPTTASMSMKASPSTTTMLATWRPWTLCVTDARVQEGLAKLTGSRGRQ